ncbi:MAG TPA: hypothetical protein VGN88_14290 [Phycisphaerae bacterium]
MPGTVIFLGAGATKSAGGPLTSEILPEILKSRISPGSTPSSTQALSSLENFMRDEFHVTSASPPELYPGLPLLMSLLDTALDRRQAFNSTWGAPDVSQLREAIELGIFDLLEEKLNKAPTNNHYDLIQKVYGMTDDPVIISTNYDLIIDTSLIFFSNNLPPQNARFPNYACDISSECYLNGKSRYGTLLKLHGSLNWLHCRTCHRLEIGASESVKFVIAFQEVVGPSLKQSYSPDGSPCPTCGTKLLPLLVAPTHLKDYRNPHLSLVWYAAERALRQADRVIFIGYSLPDDDVEVVYLLKRGLAHLQPHRITVIGHDMSMPPVTAHPVGRRYRALFGDGIDWHPEGMDNWLAAQPLQPR